MIESSKWVMGLSENFGTAPPWTRDGLKLGEKSDPENGKNSGGTAGKIAIR
jgi:hypothetical protein